MDEETLSPIAKGIAQGLKEAIDYVNNKNTDDIRVSEVEKIQPLNYFHSHNQVAEVL